MDLLESMSVFVQVAEKGSFVGAADQLDISPTMVGKHISALESRVKGRLLQRTTRRQSLTDLGRVYLDRCRHVLSEVEESDLVVENFRGKVRGTLRIACPVTFGTHGLTPALAEYMELNQEVVIELTLNDGSFDLGEKSHDVAIQIGQVVGENLVRYPLAPYSIVLAASPEYLSRFGVPDSPENLSSHRCLGFSYWDHPDVWRLIGPDGEHFVPTQGAFSANHGQALRIAALHGLGIVMQPKVLLAEDLESGRLERILADYAPPARPIFLTHLSSKRLTPKLRSFIDFVRERFGPQVEMEPMWT